MQEAYGNMAAFPRVRLDGIKGVTAMVTYRDMQIHDILDDKGASGEEKIQKLREIESEMRGLQRAASESPMNPDDGWDDTLREVRKALDSLGAKEPLKGAATL